MLGGGVKDSTEHRYYKNFMEFWKTMRKLDVSDKETWTFPSDEFILQLYVVDCAMMRNKTNSWDTIRYKLRAIDYIAQLCGKKQEWSKNPALYAVVKYCKNKCKGKGSDTIPITTEKVKRILNHTIRRKITNKRIDKGRLKRNWEIDNVEILEKEEKLWYEWSIAIAMAFTTGLRGAEQYKNEDKHMMNYGIKLGDIQWIWRGKTRRFNSSKFTKNTKNLECMVISLRNSKTKKTDETIRIAIGNNEGNIKIIYLLYRWFHIRKQQAGRDWKDKYLFSMTVQQLTEKWKIIINEMDMFEKKKWRYHGLRKGFATSLQQRGIDKGLISFAGRWAVLATIYKYITYNLENMEPIAATLWDQKRITTYGQDLDQCELDIISKLKKDHL